VFFSVSLLEIALALRTFLLSRHRYCGGHKCAGDEPGEMQSFRHLCNAPGSKDPILSLKLGLNLAQGFTLPWGKWDMEKYKDIDWLRIGLFWGGQL